MDQSFYFKLKVWNILIIGSNSCKVVRWLDVQVKNNNCMTITLDYMRVYFDNFVIYNILIAVLNVNFVRSI